MFGKIGNIIKGFFGISRITEFIIYFVLGLFIIIGGNFVDFGVVIMIWTMKFGKIFS